MAQRQRGRAWVWTASRPGFVLDVAPGRARNMVSALGAYAAICRELGLPFDFPGKPGTWAALHEITDAALLAEGVLWMLGEPRCANRAFNLANGDCFRWRDLWPWLAERFGLAPGIVHTMPLSRWMADKAPVWERLRRRHGLAPPLERVASWEFADFFLGLDHDVLSSIQELPRRPRRPAVGFRDGRNAAVVQAWDNHGSPAGIVAGALVRLQDVVIGIQGHRHCDDLTGTRVLHRSVLHRAEGEFHLAARHDRRADLVQTHRISRPSQMDVRMHVAGRRGDVPFDVEEGEAALPALSR